jgi:hypothetical protein
MVLTPFCPRMMNPQRFNCRLLALAALVALQPCPGSLAQSEIDEQHKAHNLTVLNYVTGWSLDSAGYHPALYMLLENTSGRDLSGVTIKMQGKFTDVHTLEPSTAKAEVRRTLKPHQQFPIALIAPREYELPQNTNYWPVMECKAMMRVGNVSDEGTEYLLITKVESATATEEDAFQKLNEQTSYKGSNPSSGHHDGHSRPGEKNTGDDKTHTTKPLVAKAERLKAALPAVASEKALDIFSQKSLPGLGDDFFNFEKSFGMPVSIDARKKDYTWAKYKHAGSGVEIIVCSKERTGKADLIAFLLPRVGVKSDMALIEQCKLFCGSQRTSKPGAPARSVRYLATGRLELLTASAPGLKISVMALPETAEPGGNYLVMISRLGQDPDEFLRARQSLTDVLKGLPLGEAASDKN